MRALEDEAQTVADGGASSRTPPNGPTGKVRPRLLLPAALLAILAATVLRPSAGAPRHRPNLPTDGIALGASIAGRGFDAPCDATALDRYAALAAYRQVVASPLYRGRIDAGEVAVAPASPAASPTAPTLPRAASPSVLRVAPAATAAAAG